MAILKQKHLALGSQLKDKRWQTKEIDVEKR